MADFTVRSDSVDVEQIMAQIRARVREKRGVDYTESEVQQLATVKLQKFLDAGGLRSDLLEQYRKQNAMPAEQAVAEIEGGLYASHRPILRSLRRLLNPILKLFINPTALAQRLHQMREREALAYEIVHNLVVESTRLGIEVHNLKMRVESLSARVDFDERRARALEGVVQYRRPVMPERPAGGGHEGRGPRHDRGAQYQRPPREHRQHLTQAAAPAPAPADVVATAPVAEAQASAPTGDQPSADVAPGAAALAPGVPSGAAGPGGEARRRRRRRRRRRPGQTMGDRSGQPQAAGGGAASAAAGGDSGDADAGDWDDGGGDADGSGGGNGGGD
jgi:hypothetical protein